MATYSRPLVAIVDVTPRLLRMLKPVRSPCERPHNVTTGIPRLSGSMVPLTLPKGAGSSTKSTIA